MSGRVLFQMWPPFRESLIREHLFYVEQARKRLLSQFSDIELEAERAAEIWLKQNLQRVDPEADDLSGIYEAANDFEVEHYELLAGLRDHTRLSVVSGMFHEWEKKLKDWLSREIQHWHRGTTAINRIWLADFNGVTEFMECLGHPLRAVCYYEALDACRLVVNVHKHGDGKSFLALREQYPQYLSDPFGGLNSSSSQTDYLDYTNVAVSEEQISMFSEGISAFWRDVPEIVLHSAELKLPDWFAKAVDKDHKLAQQPREG